MKKGLCFLLIGALLLCFTGCQKNPSTLSTDRKTTLTNSDGTPLRFGKTGFVETLRTTSDNTFTEPIICEYNEETITINPPAYTGLPVEHVDSYKNTFVFENGTVIVRVELEDGIRYFEVDKTGKTVNVLDEAPLRSTNFTAEITTDTPDPIGRLVGRNVMVVQTGSPDNYIQHLYKTDGTLLCDTGFDSIGYFHNGIALIQKDQKIGLIGENGQIILQPRIAFDEIRYSNDSGFYLNFLFDDTFLVPIRGEFAVVTIERK